VNDLWISNAILQSQVIEKVKHVLDGGRQDTVSVHRAEGSSQTSCQRTAAGRPITIDKTLSKIKYIIIKDVIIYFKELAKMANINPKMTSPIQWLRWAAGGGAVPRTLSPDLRHLWDS